MPGAGQHHRYPRPHLPAAATVYTANDGSGQKVLNFDAAGSTVAQLVYHGSAGDYTDGAGTLSGSDASAGAWTIDFAQTELNYRAESPMEI